MHRARKALLVLVQLATLSAVACGGGIPLRIRIDSVTVPIDVDEAMASMEQEIVSRGFLPGELRSLPEKWPDSLPDIYFTTVVASPPQPVDLTPDDAGEAKKYEQLNEVKDAIERIEINQLILRVEQNTTTVDLPTLEVQIARDKNASPEDRAAWDVIGYIPGPDQEPARAGQLKDLELQFVPGGETLFNSEIADDDKELAVRAVGKLAFDTKTNDRRPQGKAQIRVIAVVTFFVEPAALR